ncbi:MAG: hypothetical protein K2H96_00495 [Muribaculaceae bacterium]|nr:hypothetical protein [Muribaculaceae bacterium]
MRTNLLTILRLMLVGGLAFSGMIVNARSTTISSDATRIKFDGSRNNQGKSVSIESPVSAPCNTLSSTRATIPVTVKVNNSQNIVSAGEVIYAIPTDTEVAGKFSMECYDTMTFGSTINLPQGNYDIVVYISTQTAGSYFFIKENVGVNAAETIEFDLADASNEISFEAKNPNGDFLVQPTLDWNTYDVIDPGNTLWNFAFITVRHKNNEPLTELAFFNYDERWLHYDGSLSETINDMTHIWATPSEAIDFGYIRAGGMPDGLYQIGMYAENKTGIVSNDPTKFKHLDYDFHTSDFDWPKQEYDASQRHFLRNICLWDDIIMASAIKSMSGPDLIHPNDIYFCPTSNEATSKFEMYPIICSAEGMYNYKTYNIFGQPALIDNNGEVCYSILPIDDDGNLDDSATNPENFVKRIPESPHRLQYGNVRWGNTAPSITFKMYRYNSGKIWMPTYFFFGRNGENRGVDKLAKRFVLKRDGELLVEDDDTEFKNIFYNQQGTVKGKYDLEITNDNVTIDGIKAACKYQISFDLNKEDCEAPTLRFLQFVNEATGDVTDRFNHPGDGLIEFTAGDFTCVNDPTGRNSAFTYKPVETVNVEYAPNGTDGFDPLQVEEIPEKFSMPGYGAFYSGSLKGISKESTNKWYDLRITLTDAAGNVQKQLISPAFRIESIEESGIGMSSLNQMDTIYVNGGYIYKNGNIATDIEIYDTLGNRYDNNGLTNGLYIVKNGNGLIKILI